MIQILILLLMSSHLYELWYIQFYSYYNEKTSTIPKYTTNFKFLSYNEIKKNEIYNTNEENIYNLKYYKNNYILMNKHMT